MKLHVDKAADALYLRLDDSLISESEEVAPGVVLDYNERNEVVGVEMLRLSTRSSTLNLSGLEFQSTDGISLKRGVGVAGQQGRNLPPRSRRPLPL